MYPRRFNVSPRPKPKKRESGNNIADFYRGGESESDEDEQSFNMDAYSKGVLLSQATEVGTHTEDGQLRPQVRMFSFKG